jgi:hypothetical protein
MLYTDERLDDGENKRQRKQMSDLHICESKGEKRSRIILEMDIAGSDKKCTELMKKKIKTGQGEE